MKETMIKLNANIPASLHRQVKAVAAYDGRSITSVLRELLQNWVEDFEDKRAVAESRKLYKEHPREFVGFEEYARKRRQNA